MILWVYGGAYRRGHSVEENDNNNHDCNFQDNKNKQQLEIIVQEFYTFLYIKPVLIETSIPSI